MHEVCSEFLGEGRVKQQTLSFEESRKKVQDEKVFLKHNYKKQQGENSIRCHPVFLSGVFRKAEIYIQDINLIYSHPDFGLIEIL